MHQIQQSYIEKYNANQESWASLRDGDKMTIKLELGERSILTQESNTQPRNQEPQC